MTEAEVQHLAQSAADAAVEKMLLRIGVDPENPEEFAALRADLRYARSLRTATETIKRQSIKAAVSTVVIAIVGALWTVFKWKVGGPN